MNATTCAARERRVAEEAQVEHRSACAELGITKNAASSTAAATNSPIVLPLAQPHVVAAQQPEHEREEPCREEREAEAVESVVLVVARLVQVRHGADDARDPDRDVDEEDPLPAGALGEHAAGEWPDRDGEADRRAPDPEGCSALAALELLGEDRERNREHHCAADPLEAAGEVEEERAGGRSAECAEASVKRATPPMKTRFRPSQSPSVPAFRTEVASSRA